MTAVHTADLDLLDRLGGSRGCRATVHRALVRTTGRIVVAKHAPWDRPDVAAGLGREAAVLGRVQHVAVIRLLHTVEDDHGRTLVLAHAPGGSLAERVDGHGPLPPADVADIGARLAEGLAALHREGIVHRDVHPGNIVVDAELRPVLIDLDHALDASDEHLPADDEVVGHPDHVDPRLFRGMPPGPASDLHALGTTMWVLATGAPPPRPGPRALVALPADGRVPPALHEAVTACLTGTDAATAATVLRAAALDLTPTPDGIEPWPEPGEPRSGAPDRPADLPPPGVPVDEPVRLGAPVPGNGPSGGRSADVRGPSGGGLGRGVETRRWGAAPRRPRLGSVPPGRRHRWVVPAAVLVAALTPAAVGLGRSGSSATPATVTGPTVATAVVAPPPPCPGAAVGFSEAAGSTGGVPADDDVLADLDGDGCSEAMRLVDGVLTTTTGTYRLGLPGDVLVAGDWDGDEVWTPGLYRPSTGEAFLFDAGPGGSAVTSRPALALPPGATPQVVDSDGDGRHELVAANGPLTSGTATGTVGATAAT